ncbi:MAG: cupin domain-containing protein [Actinomycetota bacterium]
MDAATTTGAELRFGDWGPAYVLEGPRTLIGVCHLRSGDEMTNHYHAHHEESFLVLEGEVSVWMDCRERHVLKVGDVHRCDPYEMHYLVNEGPELMRLLFIKAPAVADDKVDVPWHPGDPVPVLANPTKEL